MFLNPNIFFLSLNSNCSNLLDMRNLQEQVKKAFYYQKLNWPFTVWIDCSSSNSWPSASNFKRFSLSLEQFFLTVGQNNFVNKIPFLFSNFCVSVLEHMEKCDFTIISRYSVISAFRKNMCITVVLCTMVFYILGKASWFSDQNCRGLTKFRPEKLKITKTPTICNSNLTWDYFGGLKINA